MAVDPTAIRPLPPLAARRALPPIAAGTPRSARILANATIASRHDLSPSVARFRVRPDEAPHVEPGQYLSLGLVVDGALVQRPYSTATPAGRHAELEFLIRLVPDGAFTPRLWALRAGDRVRLGPPKGRFTLLSDDPRTHLFIATGTGLAPFIAMLDTLHARPSARSPQVVVVHGVAHACDLAYRDRLEALAADGRIAYEPAVSRPSAPANVDWSGRTGRVDAVLESIWSDHDLAPDDTVAYLCGNPEMIAAGVRLLAERGLAADAIRSEHYWPA